MYFIGRHLFSASPAALLAMGILLAGCGEPGAPQPPSLNLPQPVRNLSAARTGASVRLAWSTLDRTTDRTTTSGPIRTHICRMEGTGPCEIVTDQPLQLGEPETYDDTLPTDMLQGPPRLLTYYIELLNHGQKSAGHSNAAYAASGASIPEAAASSVSVLAQGVELQWTPIAQTSNSGALAAMRMVRTRESASARSTTSAGKGSNLPGLAGPAESPVQTLEVGMTGGADPGRALDRTARFGETYQYQLQRVVKLTLEGHAIELLGPQTAAMTMATKDIFPPAAPQQLAAIADSFSHAIDLSWSPCTEPDLAGYVVYRREKNGAGPAIRISGAAPLIAPAFHDGEALAGTAYVYSVAAVDQSGNESRRSGEAVETLASQ